MFSNFEVTKDFEFDHVFINDMVKKFALSLSLCNCCYDLSKDFINPENYINQLYIKNAWWVLNSNATL